MGPIDFAIIAAIVLIVGGAVFYIIRAKRRGQKCIGCADAKTCGGSCANCNARCGCAGGDQETEE
jgi:hypothetical protein